MPGEDLLSKAALLPPGQGACLRKASGTKTFQLQSLQRALGPCGRVTRRSCGSLQLCDNGNCGDSPTATSITPAHED